MFPCCTVLLRLLNTVVRMSFSFFPFFLLLLTLCLICSSCFSFFFFSPFLFPFLSLLFYIFLFILLLNLSFILFYCPCLTFPHFYFFFFNVSTCILQFLNIHYTNYFLFSLLFYLFQPILLPFSKTFLLLSLTCFGLFSFTLLLYLLSVGFPLSSVFLFVLFLFFFFFIWNLLYNLQLCEFMGLEMN